MGTRSLVKFFRKGSRFPSAVFYQQYDGSPDVVGQKLALFLKNLLASFTVEDVADQFRMRFDINEDDCYILEESNPDEEEKIELAEWCEEWTYNVVLDEEIVITILPGMFSFHISKKYGKPMTVYEFCEYCEQFNYGSDEIDDEDDYDTVYDTDEEEN